MDCMAGVDACYLPGYSVLKNDPERVRRFMDDQTLYIAQGPRRSKRPEGRWHHALPALTTWSSTMPSRRQRGGSSCTSRQIAFSIPIRMALIAGMVGVD